MFKFISGLMIGFGIGAMWIACSIIAYPETDYIIDSSRETLGIAHYCS